MLQRLTHDLDVSILVAEHKLERILQFAERVIYLPGAGKPIVSGSAGDVMAVADLAPPIIHLAKEMNWKPLPLNVREARKFTLPLIDKLSSIQTVKPSSTEEIAAVENLTVQFGHTAAIDNVSIEIESGQTYAVLGRNGAGKSTLLASLAGLIEPTIGSIKVQGQNPSTLSGFKFLKSIGFVPQEPSDLLLQTSIQDECSLTDRNSGLDNGTTQQFVQEFLPSVDLRQHPLDLSEGQQLLLTLALILVNSPKLILLDEPTRGLDYLAKIDLIAHLQKIENLGVAIVIATHDVELVAELKATVLLLADGKIVASGPSREVLMHSFAYTPQIARAFNPINLLTVSEAVDAIKLAG
jgi:energy-coupling factor transport system ATP-binding protein